MPINDIRNNIVNNLIAIGVEISTPFILSLFMSKNFVQQPSNHTQSDPAILMLWLVISLTHS